MFRVSGDGTYLDYKAASEDAFSYPPSHFLGRTLADVLPPDVARPLMDSVARALRTGRVQSLRYALPLNGDVREWEAEFERVGPDAVTILVRDVTERKRMEEALSRSEARFRSMFDAAAAAMVITDLGGRLLEVNPALCRFLGYSAEELERRTVADVIHPAERAATTRRFEEMTSGRLRAMDIELQFLRKDGAVAWGHLTAVLLSDAGAAPAHAVAIIQDVTQRKTAERALLRETEFVRLLKAIAIAANEARTADEAIQATLNEVCGHMGWPVGHAWLRSPGPEVELVSTRLWHLDDPGRLAAFRSAREAMRFAAGDALPGWVLETARAVWISDLTRDEVFVRAPRAAAARLRAGMAFPVLTGREVVGVLEFFASEAVEADERTLDVMSQIGTHLGRVIERKQAEEALRASEEKYRSLFENSKDAIFIADGRGRTLAANPAFAALFGYRQEQRLALTTLFTEATERRRCIGRLLRKGALRDLEVKLRRRDGIPIDCRLTVTPRRDAGGRVVGYEGVIRDVTEQRQAELGLRNLSARLLHLQDEERRKLARELHDSVGQELAALDMNIAVALESADRLGARARQALAESQSIAQRCAKEIRTLSYLLHPPLLDERGLGSALRWLADGFAVRSGIHVVLDVSPDLGRLDREVEMALFRVAQEALSNVHRHSGSARATLRVARTQRRVTLEVGDEGRGMAAPETPRPGGDARTLGVGIRGMDERLRQIGGWLEIASTRAGTTVRAVAPARP
jgi:PAS domain S-box-containing protein